MSITCGQSVVCFTCIDVDSHEEAVVT